MSSRPQPLYLFISCYACQNGYGLDNSLCSPCSSVDYQTVNNECVLECQSPCATCSGTPTSCDSCISGSALISSHTCGSCPSGQYAHNSQCLTCESPCATCSGTSTSCDSCVLGYTLTSSHTCDSCPAGQFLYNSEYQACIAPCVTCSSTATTCTSWRAGYVTPPPSRPTRIRTWPRTSSVSSQKIALGLKTALPFVLFNKLLLYGEK